MGAPEDLIPTPDSMPLVTFNADGSFNTQIPVAILQATYLSKINEQQSYILDLEMQRQVLLDEIKRLTRAQDKDHS